MPWLLRMLVLCSSLLFYSSAYAGDTEALRDFCRKCRCCTDGSDVSFGDAVKTLPVSELQEKFTVMQSRDLSAVAEILAGGGHESQNVLKETKDHTLRNFCPVLKVCKGTPSSLTIDWDKIKADPEVANKMESLGFVAVPSKLGP